MPKTVDFTKKLILDGATGTNLMRAGMPMGVCAERWILDHPKVLTDLQRAYAEAGSDAVMAPTFEANRFKLKAHGLSDQVADLCRELVALSREAVGGKALVAGDLSPAGIFIEPFGDATFDDLLSIYGEQTQALKAAGCDYIALETFMGLTEARAALLAAKEAGLPVTVTLTVNENGRALSGGDMLACLATLAAMGADAVGLNCSTGPEIVLKTLEKVSPYLDLPLIAKPNAGLPVSGKPGVYDITPEQFADYAGRFIALGATVLGGCCGTTPEHIGLLRKAVDAVPVTRREIKTALIATSEKTAFFIDPDHLKVTAPIPCDENLAESLMELEDDGQTAARIMIRDSEEAKELGLNAYLAPVPLMLLSDNPQALERALMLYQGRVLVDRASGFSPEELQKIAGKYGAIIL